MKLLLAWANKLVKHFYFFFEVGFANVTHFRIARLNFKQRFQFFKYFGVELHSIPNLAFFRHKAKKYSLFTGISWTNEGKTRFSL